MTCTVLPEIVEPNWLILLETTTETYAGNGPGGGGVLLPGSAVQALPQAATAGLASKPLKLAGAKPPVNEFSFRHCAPQKVTGVPTAALLSPITKLPPKAVTVSVSAPHLPVEALFAASPP